MCRRLPVLLALLALLTVAAPAGAFRRVQLTAPVAHNPADRLATLAPGPEVYDPATHCSATPRPGMLALVGWLQRNARACRGARTAASCGASTRRRCTPRAAPPTGTST